MNFIKLSLTLATVFTIGQMAYAGQYTCTCKVQRSDGQIGEATARVNANSEDNAKAISKNPCMEKAQSKVSEFATGFTEYYPLSMSCAAGAVLDVE